MTGIGHNMPPRHEAFAMALQDVRLEAGNFLDGGEIETDAQANAVGKILGEARRIKSDADKARAEDKKPHLDASRKVDADYKPVLQTADDIIRAANKPLSVWLAKEQERQRAEVEAAQAEAERLRQEAIAAERASVGNVEAIEHARDIEQAAKAAEKAAKAAHRAKPQVSGATRAVGLRTRQRPRVVNYKALLLHIVNTDRAALDAFLEEYARKALPSKLPGVEIETEQVAA